MSSLTNTPIYSRTLSGLILISDGVATLSDGNLTDVNNVDANTIVSNNLSVNDINLTGSLEIPNVNDINDTHSNTVSLLNNGRTTLLNDSWYYGVITNNYNITNKLYVDTAISGIGSLYASLAGTNNFTGFNTFNTNLPTSTLIPTLTTQLVPKSYTDSNYVNITGTQTVSGAKTYSATAQFTNYLIPRLGTTNSLRLGNQCMQYQNTTLTDSFNIGWGLNALRGYYNGTNGATTNNQVKRSVCIGTNAGMSLTNDPSDITNLHSNDNVIIGDNCGSLCYYNSCQNVLIGSQVGKNNFIKNCVLIGFNVAGGTGSLYNLQNNVIIGANSAVNFSDKGSAVCVGGGNGLIQNSYTVCGYGNLLNSSFGNRLTICGTDNLNNYSADAFSACVGASNFSNLVGGFYCVGIGFNCDVFTSGIINSATIGVNSIIPRDNTFYIGSHTDLGYNGLDTYQDLCLANKNTIFCATDISNNYNINWEDGEIINIISTITTINLPTPSTSGNGRFNIGARFILTKTYSPLTNITINAPASQGIILQDGTASSSYTFDNLTTSITIACIANTGYSFQIINTNMNPSNVVHISGSEIITGQKEFSQTGGSSSLILSNTNSTVLSTTNSSKTAVANSQIYKQSNYGLDSFGSVIEYFREEVLTSDINFGTCDSRKDIFAIQNGSYVRNWSFASPFNDSNKVMHMPKGQTKQLVRAALTTNTDYSGTDYYGATINIISSTGNYILNIPSAVAISNSYITAYGQTMRFNNNTSSTLTLTSASGNFSGVYGTGTTSYILEPYQEIEIYSDGTNWNVNIISNIQQSYMQTKNAVQSVANITVASVQFQTISNISWSNTATRLTYGLVGSDYRFTNSTTYGMTLSVCCQVAFATNGTGIRMIQLIHSNTTRYGAGGVVSTSQAPGNPQIGAVCYINSSFNLNPTEWFTIQAWQNSTAALNITIVSPNTFITITRV